MYSQISQCRVCKNTDLVDIMDLGVHTLSGRFPSTNTEKIPESPLVLTKCNGGCGLVQLKYNTNRDEMYGHFYGYMSGINTTMRNHLESLIKEVESRVQITDNDTVVDIGSNDCTTLKFYKSGCKKIGVDPTGEQFRHLYPSGVSLVSDYFNSKFAQSLKTKVKVVTSIAMFYDLPDPVEFATNIRNILSEDGIWVAEQSYLPSMLATNSFDTICHEHLEYYYLKQIDYIAEKAGLKVLDVSFNDINGGSFRITFGHPSKEVINPQILQKTREEEKYLESFETYQNFVNNCLALRKQMVDFLAMEKTAGKKICVYGASTKGNVLLQYYEISNSLVDCVAERNPLKYGKFTPSTVIPIVSEDEVRKMNPDYMLVLPWHFKTEFIKREQEYLNNGGCLLFPLPNFECVRK